ncbi:hypothetical protein OTU49_015904, partial [Cherax quadricarinatus]
YKPNNIRKTKHLKNLLQHARGINKEGSTSGTFKIILKSVCSIMEPDNITEVEKLNLDFPQEVVQAIQEILPSDDPFDAPDFNTVEYINTRFPAEQSLHHIDDVLEEMRLKIASTDDQIRTVVRSLTNVDQDGRASLLNAQEAIAELFTRFQDIKISLTGKSR